MGIPLYVFEPDEHEHEHEPEFDDLPDLIDENGQIVDA